MAGSSAGAAASSLLSLTLTATHFSLGSCAACFFLSVSSSDVALSSVSASMPVVFSESDELDEDDSEDGSAGFSAGAAAGTVSVLGASEVETFLDLRRSRRSTFSFSAFSFSSFSFSACCADRQ